MTTSIRITASRLEQFRMYVNEEYHGHITKQMVIDSIKGLTPWTPQATFGSAFGAVLENGAAMYQDGISDRYVVQDGQMPEALTFSYKEIEKADLYNKSHPNMTFESWIWMDTRVNGFNIKSPMRTDGLEGLVIHENKTTSHPPSLEFYERSMQWRMYLRALSDAEFVQYNVFKYLKPTKKRLYYKVDEPVTYRFDRYADLDQDLNRWIRRFIEFVEMNDLLEYLLKK